jgi:hypothetical protein
LTATAQIPSVASVLIIWSARVFQQVGEASDPRPDAELDRLTKHAEVGRAKPWPARAGARSSSGASVDG